MLAGGKKLTKSILIVPALVWLGGTQPQVDRDESTAGVSKLEAVSTAKQERSLEAKPGMGASGRVRRLTWGSGADH